MMNTKLLVMLLVAAAAIFALAAFSSAAEIAIPNPGFEVRETYDPFPDGTDNYNQYNQESWRHFEVDNNGGPLRIWNPGDPANPPAMQGIADVGFGGNAPEGKYIVVARSRYNDNEMPQIRPIRDWEAAVQILDGTSFDPNVPYTLTAKVGRLPRGPAEGGSMNYNPNWFGYAVTLAVGGTNVGGAQYAGRVEGGTVIAQDYNTLTVAPNKFVTATVVYTGLDPNYALAGLPLQIRLCALELPEDHSLTGWAAFDDVKLKYGPLDAGDEMITWSGQPVQLAPSFGGYTPSSFSWSADPAEGVVFSPSANVEAPTVTITKPAGNMLTVTLKLEVDGGLHEDTTTIDVYDTACQAAQIGGRQAEDNPSDIDGNCITDLRDLAQLTLAWLVRTAATGPVPK